MMLQESQKQCDARKKKKRCWQCCLIGMCLLLLLFQARHLWQSFQQKQEMIEQLQKENRLQDVALSDLQKKYADIVQAYNTTKKSYEDLKETYTSLSRGGHRMQIPAGDTKAKTYMPYTAITDKSSRQWQLQQQAYTDANGFRKIGDDYLVAMGTYYGSVGTRLRIVLDSGVFFTVRLGDVKANVHTDEKNQRAMDGSVLEFIVDYAVFPRSQISGDVSPLGFPGNIQKIYRLDE